MHLGIGLLLVAGVVGDLRPDFIDLFDKHREELRFEGEPFEVNYRLFVPSYKEGASRRFPLIVWLHGYGEHGHDNVNQLKWLDALVFSMPRKQERFPFFLLAVQAPSQMAAWTGGGAGGPDMLDATKVLVEDLISRYPVDANRVYLSGVSAGGTACWTFALRYPDMFAAIAPLGSAGARWSDLQRIAHVPIWAFHSIHDPWLSPEHVRRTVYGLQSAGGNVHLTEVDSSSHDCWSAAFQEYGLLDWLLAQRRGKRSWLHAPGMVPIGFRLREFVSGWTWWQAVLQLIVIAAFGGITFRLALGVRRLVRHWIDVQRARPRKKRLQRTPARAGG